MRKISLVLGVENSQPPGTRNADLERIYQSTYKPFLSLLNKYPQILMTLFYSGNLLEWIEEYHPEFLMLLNDLVKRKQIEFLGGGYYSPVFSLIPNQDRVGQIEMLTTLLRKSFGRRPRGAWLTEQVWEPSFATTLKSAGMEYTFLDALQFKRSGLRDKDLHSTYLTDDQGKTVILFPIDSRLRQSLHSGSEDFYGLINYLEKCAASDESKVVTLIESGELFGQSNDYFQTGKLERFFQLLVENKKFISTVLPGAYVRKNTPRDKIYLNCSAYPELAQWSLDVETRKEFDRLLSTADKNDEYLLQGGYFRNFLSKYPESNLLYSKMIYTHLLVNQIKGDKYRKKAAREEHWRGESHFPFWHGKYKGLYCNRSRKFAYSAFINAEKSAREKGIFKPSLTPMDFDMDGRAEYLYQSGNLNTYIHLKGGVIFELDYLPKSWNYLDTLARHKEVYRDIETHSDGVDWYSRRCCIDHFFSHTEKLNDFVTMNYEELGDFINLPYTLDSFDRDHKHITLKGLGRVVSGSDINNVQITKSFQFKRNTIILNYGITNLSDKKLEYIFGTEMNFSFADNTADFLSLEIGSLQVTFSGEQEYSNQSDIEEFQASDLFNKTALSISSEQPFHLWHFPVLTRSVSPADSHPDYQGSCFIPRWNLALAKGETWTNAVFIRLDKK